jgi:transposase-like protein
MTARHSIPTNGHPTRKAAIIDLYEQGVQQKEIARQLECSRNSVSQVIHDYRQKTGRYIDPVNVTPPARKRKAMREPASFKPRSYAMFNYRKSVAGARQALEAMSQ